MAVVVISSEHQHSITIETDVVARLAVLKIKALDFEVRIALEPQEVAALVREAAASSLKLPIRETARQWRARRDEG